jgi:ABC-type transport system involved in multi-copper enzyme maturation permease subunit
MYFLAFAPILLFLMRAAAVPEERQAPVLQLSEMYAQFFQLFVLRFGIFFCCAVVFSQMMRGEVLEKTMHFYLLAPVRRVLIIVGKYIAGVVASVTLFGVCTAGTYVLLFYPSVSFGEFFSSGNGIPHLARYMVVTMLACAGYGAVFMMTGLLFKNPGVPTAFLLGWESLSFALPATLQNFSLVHHLQGVLPVSIDQGLFAVLTEPTAPIVSVPGILVVTAILLAISGWILGRAQITYGTD